MAKMLNAKVVCGMGSCNCCGHVTDARAKEKAEWLQEAQEAIEEAKPSTHSPDQE